MKPLMIRILLTMIPIAGLTTLASAAHEVPANDPNIQYFGRWDMSDSLHPRFSWPGVYLCTEFSGTSIGIRLDDHVNYYNLYIDGNLYRVFHGSQPGEATYILAQGLENTRHTVLLSRRNITLGESYTFGGFVLDSGATLLPPPPKPARKIEFIGDSFTAAESDEATEPQLAWEARFPVTNIDKGFAPLIARHFHAQYTTTCRSGSGMVCDWQGKSDGSIPIRFDRTLMDTSQPKWDFTRWIPDVVVICLGLNDRSGLKDSNGAISAEKSLLFRTTYHAFLATVRSVYPNVKIVAVAAYPEWIRANVKQVVDEEVRSGKTDIFYTSFDEFPGGYVANGHPTVATHKKMADQIIGAMESFNLFPGGK
ncbi:MAG: SGNH/GDSL hydrolase family protein [Bacteroidota bacterium]